MHILYLNNTAHPTSASWRNILKFVWEVMPGIEGQNDLIEKKIADQILRTKLILFIDRIFGVFKI